MTQDWVTLLLLGCLLLIAFLKYRYPKKFEDFLYIISSDKFLSGATHNNRITHPFNTVFVVLQWAITALFLFFGYCFYTNKSVGQEYLVYLYIFVGYIVFEQTKFMLERLIGHLINSSDFIKLYTFRKLVFKNFLSLFIFLCCIFLAYRQFILREYYPIFLSITGLLFLASFLVIFRKIQDELFRHPSYFILYFCTLEIAPYYILYKVFT